MEHIKIERSGSIGWIILDRPSVRNAVCVQTMQEFCAAIDLLVADADIRALAIGSSGDHFLAGGDFDFLDELARNASAESAHSSIYQFFQGVTRRLFRCRKPTLAAISGAAITVGCEITLACDVRIADETAFFEESWLRMGLIPPLGGAMLLPRIVGLTRAKEMILEGRRVSAAEALQIGLLSEIVPKHELRARAQAHLEKMTALPATAYALAKEALHRGLESSMESEWQATVLAQGILLSSNDFKNRVAARRPGKR